MKKRKKKRRKNYYRFIKICIISMFILLVVRNFSTLKKEEIENSLVNGSVTEELFIHRCNMEISEYPDELLEMLKNNPEAKEFVFNYPLKKDLVPEIDLEEYKDCDTVPLFLQWDERWGYSKYGDTMMGISGCGPTCLSMVCVYLLNDTTYNPRYIADFSEDNGYCVPGSGSAWTLISEGGKELGLDVTEISLDEERIRQNLEVDNPIICIMGPGDFTTTGHFIVMTDYIDGKIKINDPNSKVRSETLWEFEDIKYQIRNLWVCR